MTTSPAGTAASGPVTRFPAGAGTAETGEWHLWDLAREGNVISLSWALVPPAPGEQ